MVTIIDYALRQGKDGKSFVSLQLQGDVELVQSLNTGRFYATARKCSISSTFDEATAQTLKGTKFPGSIIREQCDEYSYTIPESGQEIKLAHTYTYVPEEVSAIQAIPMVRSEMEVTA